MPAPLVGAALRSSVSDPSRRVLCVTSARPSCGNLTLVRDTDDNVCASASAASLLEISSLRWMRPWWRGHRPACRLSPGDTAPKVGVVYWCASQFLLSAGTLPTAVATAERFVVPLLLLLSTGSPADVATVESRLSSPLSLSLPPHPSPSGSSATTAGADDEDFTDVYEDLRLDDDLEEAEGDHFASVGSVGNENRFRALSSDGTLSGPPPSPLLAPRPLPLPPLWLLLPSRSSTVLPMSLLSPLPVAIPELRLQRTPDRLGIDDTGAQEWRRPSPSPPVADRRLLHEPPRRAGSCALMCLRATTICDAVGLSL